jgi:hypothetical protein
LRSVNAVHVGDGASGIRRVLAVHARQLLPHPGKQIGFEIGRGMSGLLRLRTSRFLHPGKMLLLQPPVQLRILLPPLPQHPRVRMNVPVANSLLAVAARLDERDQRLFEFLTVDHGWSP